MERMNLRGVRRETRRDKERSNGKEGRKDREKIMEMQGGGMEGKQMMKTEGKR